MPKIMLISDYRFGRDLQFLGVLWSSSMSFCIHRTSVLLDARKPRRDGHSFQIANNEDDIVIREFVHGSVPVD